MSVKFQDALQTMQQRHQNDTSILSAASNLIQRLWDGTALKKELICAREPGAVSHIIIKMASLYDNHDYSKYSQDEIDDLYAYATINAENLVAFCIQYNPERLFDAGLINVDKEGYLVTEFDRICKEQPQLVEEIRMQLTKELRVDQLFRKSHGPNLGPPFRVKTDRERDLVANEKTLNEPWYPKISGEGRQYCSLIKAHLPLGLPPELTKAHLYEELRHVRSSTSFLKVYLTYHTGDLVRNGLITEEQERQLDDIFILICQNSEQATNAVEKALRSANRDNILVTLDFREFNQIDCEKDPLIMGAIDAVLLKGQLSEHSTWQKIKNLFGYFSVGTFLRMELAIRGPSARAISTMQGLWDTKSYNQFAPSQIQQLIKKIETVDDLVQFCLLFNLGRLNSHGLIYDDQYRYLNQLFELICRQKPEAVSEVRKQLIKGAPILNQKINKIALQSLSGTALTQKTAEVDHLLAKCIEILALLKYNDPENWDTHYAVPPGLTEEDARLGRSVQEAAIASIKEVAIALQPENQREKSKNSLKEMLKGPIWYSGGTGSALTSMQMASLLDQKDYSQYKTEEVNQWIQSIEKADQMIEFCLKLNPRKLQTAGLITSSQRKSLEQLFIDIFKHSKLKTLGNLDLRTALIEESLEIQNFINERPFKENKSFNDRETIKANDPTQIYVHLTFLTEDEREFMETIKEKCQKIARVPEIV